MLQHSRLTPLVHKWSTIFGARPHRYASDMLWYCAVGQNPKLTAAGKHTRVCVCLWRGVALSQHEKCVGFSSLWRLQQNKYTKLQWMSSSPQPEPSGIHGPNPRVSQADIYFFARYLFQSLITTLRSSFFFPNPPQLSDFALLFECRVLSEHRAKGRPAQELLIT